MRALLLALALASAAAAQPVSFGTDMLGGYNGDDLAVGSGFAVYGHSRAVNTPFVGMRGFYELGLGGERIPANPRYYLDNVGAGGTRCRDRVTGQFVPTGWCGDRTTYRDYFGGEAIGGYRFAALGSVVAVGGGYRFGDTPGPFALASIYALYPSSATLVVAPDRIMAGVTFGNLLMPKTR